MQSKQKKVKKIMKKFFPVPYIYIINIWLFAGKKNLPESSWTPAEKIRNFDYSKSGYFSLN